MFDNIREIHVSVRAHKDKNGELSGAPIYFEGKPVPKGIYTPKDLPPNFTWERLCRAAQRNEGHGVAIFYKGDKKVKEEVKDSG